MPVAMTFNKVYFSFLNIALPSIPPEPKISPLMNHPSENNETGRTRSGWMPHLADMTALLVFIIFIISLPEDRTAPTETIVAKRLPAEARSPGKRANKPVLLSPEAGRGKSPAKRVRPAEKAWTSISRVKDAGKRLAITFDGGSSDASAEAILDTLRERKIETTFFLTGRFIKKYPAIVKRMVAEGHEVGNHTYSHPHLTTFSENGKPDTAKGIDFKFLRIELEKTAARFTRLTGRRLAPLWRAPFGEFNNEIIGWANEAGYRHIGWTVSRRERVNMDSLDWVADKNSTLYLSAEKIKEKLLSFADGKGRAEGGIILMHLGTEREDNILHEKLGEIIDSFMAKGYEIVPVSRLIESRKG